MPGVRQRLCRRMIVTWCTFLAHQSCQCDPYCMAGNLRSVHMSSNRIEFQEWRSTSAGILASSARQGERRLTMELSMTSSFRMQAVKATFFGLPAARSRW